MAKIKIFALGGLNESGKNMYVIDVNENIFVFDAGLKYADDKMLGIDYIIPNYDYLKENKDKIKGLFLTHGHDEQFGAIPNILSDIPNLEIYGTDFTIELLKYELEDENIKNAHIHIIEPHRNIKFGKVNIFPILLTHSVPRNVGYVISTEDGAIVYTGNYVFDQAMQGAYKMDIGKLAYVGKQGVLCLMSESLYADKKGYTSPNNRISNVIRENLDYNGRILINIFQTQFYRIQEILTEIKKTDKNVVIIGKRLENMILRSIDLKYLNFEKAKILPIYHVSDDNIVVLISDEREKSFSNMNRIVKGYDKFIKISDKDRVIFASPIYEGMEKSAAKIHDDVAKIGADLVIIPSKKYLGHHASSEDLMMMINLMNPKYYMPVIGEYRHQVENAKNALKLGIKKENILLKLNGQVATFENGKLIDNNDFIKIDEILIDGKTVGDISEVVVKDREMLSDNGIVIVSVTIDKITKKIVAGPEVLTRGFIYVKDNIDIIKEAEKISLEIINENISKNYVDYNKIKMGIRDKLGKYLYKETECKPMILITISEVIIENNKKLV